MESSYLKRGLETWEKWERFQAGGNVPMAWKSLLHLLFGGMHAGIANGKWQAQSNLSPGDTLFEIGTCPGGNAVLDFFSAPPYRGG
jgi:hypothetical protein